MSPSSLETRSQLGARKQVQDSLLETRSQLGAEFAGEKSVSPTLKNTRVKNKTQKAQRERNLQEALPRVPLCCSEDVRCGCVDIEGVDSEDLQPFPCYDQTLRSTDREQSASTPIGYCLGTVGSMRAIGS